MERVRERRREEDVLRGCRSFYARKHCNSIGCDDSWYQNSAL